MAKQQFECISQNITLHAAKAMDMHRVLLYDLTRDPDVPDKVSKRDHIECWHSSTETGYLVLDVPIHKQHEYRLRFEYTTPIKQNMVGLYLSEVRNGDEKK